MDRGKDLSAEDKDNIVVLKEDGLISRFIVT